MGENIHRKHFAGGRETPAEMHRRLVFAGQTCAFCGDPKVALALKMLAQETEFIAKYPNDYLKLLERAGGDPGIDTKYGKMLIVNRVFACDPCKGALRAMAARQPSWILPEFDEGGLDATYVKQV